MEKSERPQLLVCLPAMYAVKKQWRPNVLYDGVMCIPASWWYLVSPLPLRSKNAEKCRLLTAYLLSTRRTLCSQRRATTLVVVAVRLARLVTWPRTLTFPRDRQTRESERAHGEEEFAINRGHRQSESILLIRWCARKMAFPFLPQQ